MNIYIIFVVIAVIALISSASAAPTSLSPLPTNQTIRVSAETGENYIQWSWKTDNGSMVTTPVNIYLDDASTPVATNYTRSGYLMLNLKPDERHNIALYQNINGTSTLAGKATITTTNSGYVVYAMIFFCFVLLIVILAINDTWQFVLLSILDIVVSLFGSATAVGHGMAPYILIGIAIITGLILLIQGLPKLREQIAWL
jgi:hypothetical protein